MYTPLDGIPPVRCRVNMMGKTNLSFIMDFFICLQYLQFSLVGFKVMDD